MFGDRAIDTAIPDRLLHHAVILNIRSKSQRITKKVRADWIGTEESKS